MHSRRSNWHQENNDLTTSLCTKRKAGEEILDLTCSNPTAANFDYPYESIENCIGQTVRAPYEPEAKGLVSARRALAAFYRTESANLEADQFVITASTSEAYAFLFKFLCDPGDRILTSSPGYPLIDFVASLECVNVDFFPMLYDGRWSLDLHRLELAMADTPKPKAIVLVHPANPTGSYIKLDEYNRLIELSKTTRTPLIVDEVFYDYSFDHTSAASDERPSFARAAEGLVFVLGGLSKSLALPQWKLSWILATGDAEQWRPALDRLSHIADLFLSVGTPIQRALPGLLDMAPTIRTQVINRCAENLRFARHSFSEIECAINLAEPEGGWYALARLPEIRDDEAWALLLLEKNGVYTLPGSRFGLSGCYLVLSLLPPSDVFTEAVNRLKLGVANGVPS